MEKGGQNEVRGRQFRLAEKKSSCAHGVGWRKSIMNRSDQFHSVVHFKVKNGPKVFFGAMHGAKINPSCLNFRLFLGWHDSKRQLCRNFSLRMGIKTTGTYLF